MLLAPRKTACSEPKASCTLRGHSSCHITLVCPKVAPQQFWSFIVLLLPRRFSLRKTKFCSYQAFPKLTVISFLGVILFPSVFLREGTIHGIWGDGAVTVIVISALHNVP